MSEHPKEFWRRLQQGVEVTVAGAAPERLLGVRDAFVRYFQQGLQRSTSVVVVPQPGNDGASGLPMSDQATLALARTQAVELRQRLGETYHFYVAVEGGMQSLDFDGRPRYFIRSWSVVASALGEAWGSSGAVQLPDRFLSSELTGGGGRAAVPGTRRQGGIISSVTAGLETRRTVVAESTFHALSTLCYGVLQSRAGE